MSDCYVLRNLSFISNQKIDIMIEAGKIAAITSVGEKKRHHVVDCSGKYVSSGWIDLHVHAFPEFTPYGDELDEIGVKQGVTTVVDAGSCGADRMADLIKSTQHSKTNLFAFLNISQIGLERIDELSNMSWVSEEKIQKTVDQYKDIIVGLKARISSSVVKNNGVKPLRIAKEISNNLSLPIMVHIGSGPPNIRDIVPLMQEHDILTHYLHAKSNNLFDSDGMPLQVLTDAIERGIHLDVGHGTSSFSFKVAEIAKDFGIKFNTISTDIYRYNRLNGPVYSLAHVLSKFLYLGYPLEEVIAAATVNAAKWLNRPELGRIKIGDPANLTLFTVDDQPVTLIDSEGDKRIANRRIQTKGVVVNGEFMEC
ncbi:amidohydrolase/deacetylase family metallohydrolase [Radiobacillus kanasensis]|uniref:amidohydrolase/deacetylase family metallohydrolase n=1 Tax=Radiobacillus kanasensis TaxID=2844358 RepID=UPI001E4D031A|nr:amidohydrolase/deacetylase family metallohydrolase [Radiobacillus kanasensis]UFT98681.1 amidohydrolase/deacetylase family metallohydrolase [Radiobacillus kanasensis]